MRPFFSVSSSTCGMIAGLLVLAYVCLSFYSFQALHNELRAEEEINLGWNHRNNKVPKDVPLPSEAQFLKASSSIGLGPWSTSFTFDRDQAEAALKSHGAPAIRRILTAYAEPPLDDIIPGTGSRGDLTRDKDKGVPPQFVIPLPLRTHTPNDLQKFEYKRIQTCHDMPHKFPVDRGLEFDKDGNVVVWNVGDVETPDDFAEQEAPFCPVEADPFLPWIHDVFPSQDGSRIEFIAQNKRRCRTGKKFTKDVDRLVPQVALMQPVSVERIHETQARSLAPQLWIPKDEKDSTLDDGVKPSLPPRYRLAPFNESAPDGLFTRYICRFYATRFGADMQPELELVGETLSQYPFNYEYAAYRKGPNNLLTAKGKDTQFFWASNSRFNCPVPNVGSLQRDIAFGNVVLSDGTPTVYLDLVPIRTSARYDEVHLTEDQIGPPSVRGGVNTFDPITRWGKNNVIPRVEASGRWSNIPICQPPKLSDENGQTRLVPDPPKSPNKPHFLSACLWAAAEFKTRGRTHGADMDTLSRFEEWIEFHLMVGFDHIYVYDNSGAHTNETSLEQVTQNYPGKITRIEWPAIPCNNNIPAHDSTGERSSQYAAENSCRTRFAPFTEYIGVFDTDEYLVPMGEFDNLKDVIRKAAESGTEVLSFRSSRGKFRPDVSESYGSGVVKRPNTTYLQTYNCDSGGIPKPSWAERARKQIYRSDYVLYHFVHYSTVTQTLMKTYAELGSSFSRGHHESSTLQRATNEIDEAVMVHAKTVLYDMTKGYKEQCHKDYAKKWKGCWVAAPWPDGKEKEGEDSYDSEGILYNCFLNEKVENYWVPKLQEALMKRRKDGSGR